ncbi:MAG: hypothetical protein R3C41_07010 [Calditrichia bacterium]
MLESMTMPARKSLRFIQGHFAGVGLPAQCSGRDEVFTRRNPAMWWRILKILEQRQTIEISGFTSVEFDLITIHPQFEDAEMKKE